MIYLDNAASTQVSQSVINKLISTIDTYGNPSSIHTEGLKAKNIINESKTIIANKLNCNIDEIFFTTGATMSNNIILQGFSGSVLISEIEHEDIQMIANKYNFEKISVDNYGYINSDDLRTKINDELYWNNDKSILVSIQMANSEIGTIQDIINLSKIIHSYPNVFLHVDATQYIPYYPIDVNALKIDALSMSGQKIGCIKGTGMLYISNELQKYVKPLIYGKQGLIGGTENTIGIACLGEAFDCLNYDNTKIIKMRDNLINNIHGKLIGSAERLPNNVCMYFEGIDNQTFVRFLNDYGVCCSAGSACSSTELTPSATLLSIGLTPNEANCCVRFTVGNNNTDTEINEAIDIINSSIQFLKDI